MKLALSLVFLAFNVQLISGIGFMHPFHIQPQFMHPYGSLLEANPQLAGTIQNGQPIIYENSGLDQEGNPFYEKQVIQSFQQQIPISPYNADSLVEQIRQRQQLLAGANTFQDSIMRQQMALQMQQQQQQQQEMQMRMGAMMSPMGPMSGLLGSLIGQLMQQQEQQQEPQEQQLPPGLRFHLVEQPTNAEQEQVELLRNLALQQQQQEQELGVEDQVRSGMNNIFEKIFDVEDQILNSPESDDQKEQILNQQEADQQQAQQELHRKYFEEHDEQQRQPEESVRNLEFMTPESAINFQMNVRPHEVPKKGQFHLRQAKYEHAANDHELDGMERQTRTEMARKIEHQKFDFVMAPLAGENGVELLEKEKLMPEGVVSEMEPIKNNDDDLRGDENSLKQIELEKAVDANEKSFLERVKGEAQGLQLLQPEDLTNSVYLRLSDKITESDADRLLNSVSRVAALPAGSVRDVRSRDNLLMFDVEFDYAQRICQVVETFHQAVFEENGLKLVSCSLEAPHKHSFDSNKVLFIVTVIVCVTVICVLIGLIGVFFVKRRDYLRQKLIENVSNLKLNKGKFDDIERLVTDESTRNRIKNKVWPFKTKQVNTQQADLCRSANLSPLSSTQTTELSNRTENFESTPVVVDERKGSTRSSASS